MKKLILFMMVFTLTVLVSACGSPPAPIKARAEKSPQEAALEKKIAATTEEGKQFIEQAKGMKPEVNDQISAKTLGEKVEDFSKNNGSYNITPIGWEAAQKGIRPGEKSARWKVLYHYKSYDGQLLTAEWEYNPDTKKLYPWEKTNAPTFWDPPPAQPAQGAKPKKT
jgi:hypothetical protein